MQPVTKRSRMTGPNSSSMLIKNPCRQFFIYTRDLAESRSHRKLLLSLLRWIWGSGDAHLMRSNREKSSNRRHQSCTDCGMSAGWRELCPLQGKGSRLKAKPAALIADSRTVPSHWSCTGSRWRERLARGHHCFLSDHWDFPACRAKHGPHSTHQKSAAP